MIEIFIPFVLLISSLHENQIVDDTVNYICSDVIEIYQLLLSLFVMK